MYCTIGGFTLDDTILPTGEVRWAAPGGNALYSALGARFWADDVSIVALVGEDYPEEYLDRLLDAGLDISCVARVDSPSFHVWILHEGGGRRQIVYRLDSGTNEYLDPSPEHLSDRCLQAKGVHICPILGSSQARLMETLFENSAPTFLDLIDIPNQIDPREGHRMDLWSRLRALIPSIEEARVVWGERPLGMLVEEIRAVGSESFAIKLGEKGSVVGGQDGPVYHIPAIPTNSVDPTGAGDAYCGGFMVGLEEFDDPVEAGLRGTVSSSFVIEDFGALHALNVDRSQVQNRLESLRRQVMEFKEPISRIEDLVEVAND